MYTMLIVCALTILAGSFITLGNSGRLVDILGRKAFCFHFAWLGLFLGWHSALLVGEGLPSKQVEIFKTPIARVRSTSDALIVYSNAINGKRYLFVRTSDAAGMSRFVHFPDDGSTAVIEDTSLHGEGYWLRTADRYVREGSLANWGFPSGYFNIKDTLVIPKGAVIHDFVAY